jgi:PAS domain S-box-containing protein
MPHSLPSGIPEMPRRIHPWTTLLTGLFACLLIVAGSICYREIRSLYENSGWVSHTHEVIGALEGLLATITTAETGQRGYIISQQDQYAAEYEAARAETYAALAHVDELTSDNPQQQQRISQLKTLTEARLAEMQISLDLAKNEGFEAARARVAEGRGRAQMVELRGLVNEVEAAEQELLSSRQQANNATFGAALWTVVLSTLVGLAALAVVWYLVGRYVHVIEKAASEIHNQRELLHATLISIGDGVIATDDRGRVTILNGVAQRLTGWSQAEAVGQPLSTVFNIVNEETRQPVDNPAERALRQGEVVGLANHTILIAKNGAEWPLDDSAAPIRTREGEVRGAVLVFREISERKAQEKQLAAQARELAEADQRKNEFLATLAHELRNPLSPLSNALQLWPLVNDNAEEVERLRLLMMRQLRQLTRLIDDLLDISRVTRGHIHLKKQRVDIAAPIHEAIEAVKPLIDVANQRLTVALPSRPVIVEGDVARLTQVFGNILNNASKFTGRDGVIWIGAEASDGHITVRVRDNGPGIPAKMLTEIFEMFRQGDDSLERANGGLGIGLTLVKRLVEEHGGTIEARSDGPGQGSEFIVTLPTTEGESLVDNSRPTRYGINQLAGIPKHRILVVDDVAASAHTLAMMLRAVGQEVSEANDGPSGIEWALANRPAVIFLDIAMPGMSGYDVARRLRSELPGTVLVALTGYGQEEDRKRALDAGFDRHLVKPTSLETLKELLAAVSPQSVAANDGQG